MRKPLACLAGLATIGMLCASPFTVGAAFAESMPGMAMGGATEHHGAHEHFAFGAPARARQATRSVRINIVDLAFEPSQVTVRAGEVVRFVIHNTSSIDHEFTLGDAATEVAHRREMAEMAEHGAGMAHDDPNAITVKPGQTRELTWRFARAGQL